MLFREDSSESPFDLATPTGTLRGTLRLPAGEGPFPVALLHAGSGPTDRDGNSAALPGANDSLKLLAQGLAERGIAGVRFDKRGIAASAAAGPTSEAEIRFDTYVDDAARWVERLAADARFAGVTIVGHSEGSLIGMVEAKRSPARAFVSLEGAGRRAGDVLREQLGRQLPAPLLERAKAVIEALEAGRTVDDFPVELVSLFRPSVQPYLISWLKYDPAAEIASLAIPVAIVQGTTDIQTGVEDAERLARANPAAQLTIVEGMNHVLKEATLEAASQQRAYTDPSLPVVPAVIEAIAACVKGAAR